MDVDKSGHYDHARCIDDVLLLTRRVFRVFNGLDACTINGNGPASNICCDIYEASIT